jgi:hypothetical protein
MEAQDRRLEAIAAAAAAVLAENEYHRVRTQDIAARVHLDGSEDGRSSRGSRSAVWVYNEARSRRVLVALAARHAWNDYLAHADHQTHELSVFPGNGLTVTGASGLVGAALLEIARFHRAADFLMRQVGLGIGDIATSEKRVKADDQGPPSWPDSEWGRVAADGFAGKCSVFADYLAPVLFTATRSVSPFTRTDAQAQASALSDLAFRALLADREGPLDRISEGLAAYWFERDLVRVAGRWIHSLAAAERGLARSSRRAQELRANAAALAVLADVLLEAGTLNARCAAEGATRVRFIMDVTGFQEGTKETPTEPSDMRALCDAASRQGLALYRFGDLEGAGEAQRLARAVAEQELAGHNQAEADSYIARADHNLAEVAFGRADLTEAASLSALVYEQRQRLAADDSMAAWRRFSLTGELRLRIAIARGTVTKAVNAAKSLRDDRMLKLGSTEDPYVVAARVVLGRAFLVAGHPLSARHHLEAAHRFHFARSAAFGFQVQRDVVALAEIALALDDPMQAEELLPSEDVVQWIAENVSFRLATTIRRLRASAFARIHRGDEAEALVNLAVADLANWAPERADPDRLALDRCRAEILWRTRRPEEASEILESVRAAEATLDGGIFSVASALTLRQLARCADSSGDKQAAIGYHATLRAKAVGIIDPTHVALLRADLHHARRLLKATDIHGAARSLVPLLDRRPLAHGLPALEDGHPLLAAAQRLAEEIGIPSAELSDHDWLDD